MTNEEYLKELAQLRKSYESTMNSNAVVANKREELIAAQAEELHSLRALLLALKPMMSEKRCRICGHNNCDGLAHPLNEMYDPNLSLEVEKEIFSKLCPQCGKSPCNCVSTGIWS